MNRMHLGPLGLAIVGVAGGVAAAACVVGGLAAVVAWLALAAQQAHGRRTGA